MLGKRAKNHVEEEGGLLNILGKLFVTIAALLVVDYLIPGFDLNNLQAAIVAAVVIGVINTFIRPIVQLIALPISILTLGIAAFFINVFLLMGAAALVPGFEIDSLLTATISSILLALVSAFLGKIAKSR